MANSPQDTVTTKHTPGPWAKFGPFSLPDMNGRRDAWTVSARDDTQLIAEIYTDANAALIAAAPDLLVGITDALLLVDQLLAWHHVGLIHFPDDSIKAQLQAQAKEFRAAIARAEGHQP